MLSHNNTTAGGTCCQDTRQRLKPQVVVSGIQTWQPDWSQTPCAEIGAKLEEARRLGPADWALSGCGPCGAHLQCAQPPHDSQAAADECACGPGQVCLPLPASRHLEHQHPCALLPCFPNNVCLVGYWLMLCHTGPHQHALLTQTVTVLITKAAATKAVGHSVVQTRLSMLTIH